MQIIWFENILFLGVVTLFVGVVGWAWRDLAPYQLPNPLPGWFRFWFGTVQVLGIIPPLGALIGWGIWQQNAEVLAVFASYFLMLGLQILTEYLTLRQFHTVVWVMVPYLYLPYRIWQLYEGLNMISLGEAGTSQEWFWISLILWGEIILWTGNYLLDLAQLPRLFYWKSLDR
ncbi:MAG: hypothetical protein Kow00121_12990 [Elainellaceae cyanobacterium]